ncbi:UNVERIFIED_CONTAM: protein LURP-one-related 15 [Sesamum calycinum]|uniref:Protein LURP-one-related 15 n=1 Tax=Sesamum calycinum TaxID=2727403 RepID=A0AAW2NUE1_9LAMI
METCHGQMDSLTAVISSQFCVPGNLSLTIVRKPRGFTNGKFKVTDDKGNYVFNVKEKMLSIHGRLLLLDSGSNPIVTFKKKFKIELDIFLAGNEGNNSWDFKVVGNWVERSCIVYDKDSTPVAQIQKKRTFGGIVLGKDTLKVTVYPQVDYAFIVALIVILYEIKRDGKD